MRTLGNRLQDRSEYNLNFLRFKAALLVIFSHCFGLLGHLNTLTAGRIGQFAA